MRYNWNVQLEINFKRWYTAVGLTISSRKQIWTKNFETNFYHSHILKFKSHDFFYCCLFFAATNFSNFFTSFFSDSDFRFYFLFSVLENLSATIITVCCSSLLFPFYDLEDLCGGVRGIEENIWKFYCNKRTNERTIFGSILVEHIIMNCRHFDVFYVLIFSSCELINSNQNKLDVSSPYLYVELINQIQLLTFIFLSRRGWILSCSIDAHRSQI